MQLLCNSTLQLAPGSDDLKSREGSKGHGVSQCLTSPHAFLFTCPILKMGHVKSIVQDVTGAHQAEEHNFCTLNTLSMQGERHISASGMLSTFPEACQQVSLQDRSCNLFTCEPTPRTRQIRVLVHTYPRSTSIDHCTPYRTLGLVTNTLII